MLTPSEQAREAIKAARLTKMCGRYAMMQYCLSKHVPLALWRLARQLQAAQAIKEIQHANR